MCVVRGRGGGGGEGGKLCGILSILSGSLSQLNGYTNSVINDIKGGIVSQAFRTFSQYRQVSVAWKNSIQGIINVTSRQRSQGGNTITVSV